MPGSGLTGLGPGWRRRFRVCHEAQSCFPDFPPYKPWFGNLLLDSVTFAAATAAVLLRVERQLRFIVCLWPGRPLGSPKADAPCARSTIHQSLQASRSEIPHPSWRPAAPPPSDPSLCKSQVIQELAWFMEGVQALQWCGPGFSPQLGSLRAVWPWGDASLFWVLGPFFLK